jgi:hypothetical protein
MVREKKGTWRGEEERKENDEIALLLLLYDVRGKDRREEE